MLQFRNFLYITVIIIILLTIRCMSTACDFFRIVIIIIMQHTILPLLYSTVMSVKCNGSIYLSHKRHQLVEVNLSVCLSICLHPRSAHAVIRLIKYINKFSKLSGTRSNVSLYEFEEVVADKIGNKI